MIHKILILLAIIVFPFATPVPKRNSFRIVGGSNASIVKIPWQASLRTFTNFHFCGGSIISNRWVISAAHCTINRPGNSLNVFVGAYLLNFGGVAHRSLRIINHPAYNSSTVANDVSVIKTATTIEFNVNVQAVPMSSAFVEGGRTVIVSGWGGTRVDGGPSPNHLQSLTKQTLSNKECKILHTRTNAKFVFDHKICTFNRPGQGICQGDSGGPLTLNGELIGIVSWNIPCARRFPDVYDRISSHRQWIQENTGI